MPSHRDDDLMGRLLDAATRAGAAEAEVFRKAGRGRRLTLEPSPALVGKTRRTLSGSEEEGAALRVRDRAGRWGLAWASAGRGLEPRLLAEAACAAAARAGPVPVGDPPPLQAPCARPGSDGVVEDLGILDTRALCEPVPGLEHRLRDAADGAASVADGAARVDRVVLSEAIISVAIATTAGFRAGYDRSLVLLSVSLAPLVQGARAILEERSASHLDDLDPRACGLEAGRRSLPPRPTVPPPGADLPLLLSPRVAASFLATLVPWILVGVDRPGADRPGPITATESPAGRGLALIDDGRLRGGFGSAPFDGVGRPTGRTTLLRGGRIVGGLSMPGGNVCRASFRDPPRLGLTNLVVPPGGEEETLDRFLRVVSARFLPGAAPRLLIQQGEWETDGTPAGAADGIVWEGTTGSLVRGVRVAPGEARDFHAGLPVRTPPLLIGGPGRYLFAARRGAGGRRARLPAPRPQRGAE
jgi:predicted Zn-dependent protease